MTTLVIVRAPADVAKLEEFARSDPNPLAQLAQLAPEGVLRHRTFATDSEVIVVDEWERPEDFQQWISRPEVQEMIGRAGVTAQPEILFARKLDLGDEIG